MGCRELIESLKAAGDGKLKALRADAEREAEQIRADAARRIASLEQEHARKHAAETARQAEAVLAAANRSVRDSRLRSESALSQRLYAVARSSLHVLRNEGYPDVLTSFARELPRFTWKTVRVNPADAALTRELFPGAEVQTDDAIAGGLEAVSEGGRVRVVNTFEKRLERMWEEILPEIMQDAKGSGA